MRGFGSVSPLGVSNNIACFGTSFAFCVLCAGEAAFPAASSSFRASCDSSSLLFNESSSLSWTSSLSLSPFAIRDLSCITLTNGDAISLIIKQLRHTSAGKAAAIKTICAAGIRL